QDSSSSIGPTSSARACASSSFATRALALAARCSSLKLTRPRCSLRWRNLCTSSSPPSGWSCCGGSLASSCRGAGSGVLGALNHGCGEGAGLV
ncbi:Adenylosuccinate synthetase, partial [Frankliniella fusca]